MIAYIIPALPFILISFFKEKIRFRIVFLCCLYVASVQYFLIPLGSRDYFNYLNIYRDVEYFSLEKIISQDPLYGLISWIGNSIGVSAEIYLFVFSSFAIFLKIFIFHKLCEKRILPIAIYMCSYYYLHEFTQVRAAVAIGIWLCGVSFYKQKISRYLFFTLIASLIHLQMILGFLLLPIFRYAGSSTKRLHTLSFVLLMIWVGSIIFNGSLHAAELVGLFPDSRVEIYFSMASENEFKANPVSAVSLISVAIGAWALALSSRRKVSEVLDESAIPAICCLFLGAIFLSFFSSVPVLAFRFSEQMFIMLPIGMAFIQKYFPHKIIINIVGWSILMIFVYIFLIYSPGLIDPTTGFTKEDMP